MKRECGPPCQPRKEFLGRMGGIENQMQARDLSLQRLDLSSEVRDIRRAFEEQRLKSEQKGAEVAISGRIVSIDSRQVFHQALCREF